jgi:thiopurine S-methyltransferase
MEFSFWEQRWKEGRIGFHEGRPNAFLAKHAPRLGSGRRVLVPLCGKTSDLAYLAGTGHAVVGVEFARQAVEAFFQEHELGPLRVTDAHHGRVHSAGSITIHEADFFACGPAELGPLDALYDRAAMVAVRPDARPAYVQHLRSLLAPGSVGLVIAFDYDSSAIEGPPFPVGEAEVRRLYAGARVELLEEQQVEPPRFREAGVAITERCFAVSM